MSQDEPNKDEIRQRTISNMRYWVEHNTYRMGRHDLNVLRDAIGLLEGAPPTECHVGIAPLPPPGTDAPR